MSTTGIHSRDDGKVSTTGFGIHSRETREAHEAREARGFGIHSLKGGFGIHSDGDQDASKVCPRRGPVALRKEMANQRIGDLGTPETDRLWYHQRER